VVLTTGTDSESVDCDCGLRLLTELSTETVD
jgi:hypothetical protein